MKKSEFLKQLEEQVIMPDEDGTIQPETLLNDIEEWDSLAVVAFLAFSDRELGLHVNPEQVKRCETIQDIMNLVSSKLED